MNCREKKSGDGLKYGGNKAQEKLCNGDELVELNTLNFLAPQARPFTFCLSVLLIYDKNSTIGWFHACTRHK